MKEIQDLLTCSQIQKRTLDDLGPIGNELLWTNESMWIHGNYKAAGRSEYKVLWGLGVKFQH
jgi:hypothetical protein